MSAHRVPWFLALLLALAAGGCSSTRGIDPDAQPDIPKPDKTYSGLSGQLVAVMVWADGRTRSEYPYIQLDLARAIENSLTPPPLEDKKEEAKRQANLPRFVDERSIVRFQREHPEIEGEPITQVAPRLGGATRVIYIELEQFDLRSPRSILLLKGTAKATLRVVEVNGRQAEVKFEDHGIEAGYPPNAPEGVVESDKENTMTIYKGTVTLLADTIAVRFNEQTRE